MARLMFEYGDDVIMFVFPMCHRKRVSVTQQQQCFKAIEKMKDWRGNQGWCMIVVVEKEVYQKMANEG